ncbi:MAG: thiolase family protein, partial [bacterium]
MRDAYIVSAVRTPGCRRARGAFSQTRPEDLLSHILAAACEKINLDKGEVDDIITGCSFPEAEQGLNVSRVALLMAGFPKEVAGAVVNRFCASGLESIAQSAMKIKCGWADITMGAGLESMSIVPMGGNMPRPHPDWSMKSPDVYTSMGVTAENVVSRYNITRDQMDEFAYNSHMKAAKAQKEGLFKEIVPTPAHKYVEHPDGTWEKTTKMQDFDDGVRPETTIEGLGKLRGAFKAGGTVTAGNSSQTTDGAAANVIMSEEAMKRTGAKPLARIVAYAAAGCEPDEMGVGPVYAIPKVLKIAGMKKDDIDIFELNEAFASQALYSIRELGLDVSKVNLHGGAIALGHPLGCTGSKIMATLVNNLHMYDKKYGIESMCIGGGMGAAM